jgi:hypothetical protein
LAEVGKLRPTRNGSVVLRATSGPEMVWVATATPLCQSAYCPLCTVQATLDQIPTCSSPVRLMSM